MPLLPPPRLPPPSLTPDGRRDKLDPRRLSTYPVAHEPEGARPAALGSLHGVAALAAADRRRKHKADRAQDTEPGQARPAPLTALRCVGPLAAANRGRKSKAERQPDTSEQKQKQAQKQESSSPDQLQTDGGWKASSRRDATAAAVSSKRAGVATAAVENTTTAASQGSRRASLNTEHRCDCGGIEHNCRGTEQTRALPVSETASDTNPASRTATAAKTTTGAAQGSCDASLATKQGGKSCRNKPRHALQVSGTVSDEKSSSRPRRRSGSSQQCESDGGRGRGPEAELSGAMTIAAVLRNNQAPACLVASTPLPSKSAPRGRSKGGLATAPPRNNTASRGQSEDRLAVVPRPSRGVPLDLSEGRLASSPPGSNITPRGRSESRLAVAPPLTNSAPRGLSEGRLASTRPSLRTSPSRGRGEARLASSGSAAVTVPRKAGPPARLASSAPRSGRGPSRVLSEGRLTSDPSPSNSAPRGRNGGTVASHTVGSADAEIRGAGRRRAERREILRWMGRLGVKVRAR